MCGTRKRAGFPRERPRNPTYAGDRPPHYDKKRHFTVGRGPVPRHASRSENNVSCSLQVLKDLKRPS